MSTLVPCLDFVYVICIYLVFDVWLMFIRSMLHLFICMYMLFVPGCVLFVRDSKWILESPNTWYPSTPPALTAPPQPPTHARKNEVAGRLARIYPQRVSNLKSENIKNKNTRFIKWKRSCMHIHMNICVYMHIYECVSPWVLKKQKMMFNNFSWIEITTVAASCVHLYQLFWMYFLVEL